MLSLMSTNEETGSQYWVNSKKRYQVRTKEIKTKIGNILVLRVDTGFHSKESDPLTFDELMSVKNAIAGSSAQAIEIFPHTLENEPLDGERTLWVFPKGKELPLNPNEIFTDKELE